MEWGALGSVAVLAGLVPLAVARRTAHTPIPSVAQAWLRIRAHPASLGEAATSLGLLRGVLLFAAAVAALLLFVDPRYRDFPTLLYLVPALAFGVLGWRTDRRIETEERLCALVLAVSVTGRWLSEPANPQAIAWLLTGLVFAAPALRRSANQQQ
jgi:glucan 1,3-beta-glucosidase